MNDKKERGSGKDANENKAKWPDIFRHYKLRNGESRPIEKIDDK